MSDKRKKVLFIYEGIKAEENLLNNMIKIFFSSKVDVSILNCPADGNIYMLWTKLKKDEFETNVVDVLKEMSMIAKTRLNNLRASDFSEIYLSLDEISEYKKSFASQTDFSNYSCIDKKYWLIACNASRKRASLLAKYNSLCTYDYFIHNLGQEKLYLYQKKNYINNGHLLCILNSVPLFLLEYYQEDFWNLVTAI